MAPLLIHALRLSDGYVQAPDGSKAVAAAALIAAGKGFDVTDPAASDLLRNNPIGVDDQLVQAAVTALDRVIGDESELRELWKESDSSDSFKAMVAEIRAALTWAKLDRRNQPTTKAQAGGLAGTGKKESRKKAVRRIRCRPGDIVRIPLEDGIYAYGRLLDSLIFQAFDVQTADDAPPENITELPILFIVWIGLDSVERGRWPIVGHVDLTEEERTTPVKFSKQDSISGRLTIYWSDPVTKENFEIPTSLEECHKLERAAVWRPEHLEDRLRDHFEGQPNKWVEALQIKT